LLSGRTNAEIYRSYWDPTACFRRSFSKLQPIHRPLSIQPISGISLLIFLGGTLLGAFGEELGWRGYLQRIVEGKLNVLIASLLVGVLWGLWHVMNYQFGPIYLLFFVLFACACSVIMAWLLKGTDYNVVIAGLFHFVVNVGFYILLRDSSTLIYDL
jgi:membrane protease YdiL (CAAX protease family)